MSWKLYWFTEVVVNGVIIKPQDEVICEAGDCVSMKVSVVNNLKRVINQLILTVQFYQDYENGNSNYRMDTRLATTGSTKWAKVT